MRLRTRILLTTGLIAILAAGLASLPLYRATLREGRAALHDRMATNVQAIAILLESGDLDAASPDLDARIDAMASAIDARLSVIGRNGDLLADSEFDAAGLAELDNHNSRAEVIAARAGGVGHSDRYSRSTGINQVYLARLVESGASEGVVLRTSMPRSRFEAVERAAQVQWLGALGVALAVATLATFIWSRRLGRPIERLRVAAEEVRDGRKLSPVRIRTRDELQALAEALEGARVRLAGRIAEAVNERDRIEAVLTEMAEGVVVTGADGLVTLANPAVSNLFGVDAPEPGQTVMEAVRQPEIAAAMDEALHTPSARVIREVAVSYPEERTLRLHATGLQEGGVVGVFHDVTALKRVNVMRQDFVANVSHELRTPLATIAAHAESLSDPSLGGAERQESIGAIRRQVARLTALVADLLELSRLEARPFEPTRERIDISALVAQIADEWREEAARHGQQIDAEVATGLHLAVDRNLVRQAIGNLIENAVRYAGDGARIRVGVQRAGELCTIDVTDDGPGIRPEDQPRVFERFYRVEKARGRVNGGTGLGLAIVKHVAEVHGGQVTLDSRPGQGARFRVTLPVVEGVAASEPA